MMLKFSANVAAPFAMSSVCCSLPVTLAASRNWWHCKVLHRCNSSRHINSQCLCLSSDCHPWQKHWLMHTLSTGRWAGAANCCFVSVQSLAQMEKDEKWGHTRSAFVFFLWPSSHFFLPAWPPYGPSCFGSFTLWFHHCKGPFLLLKSHVLPLTFRTCPFSNPPRRPPFALFLKSDFLTLLFRRSLTTLFLLCLGLSSSLGEETVNIAELSWP